MKITEQIENDLKLRIDAGVDYPKHITLNGLSELYQVSLTPVRKAVNCLIEEKYVIKQANGRLEINAKKVGLGALNIKNFETGPSIEESLLREVVQQSLKGPEVFLREEACAERFGVGRTVIRGIFNHLDSRGVIQHVPRCGWKVYSYSHDDMCSFLDIREIMEIKALNLSKGKIKPQEIEELVYNNQLNQSGEQQLDDDLHNYFIDCSENRYIKDFFEKQGLYWSALFNYAAPETASVTIMACEHREILQSVLKDDWNNARKVLTQHIRSQEPIISKLVNKISSSLNSKD